MLCRYDIDEAQTNSELFPNLKSWIKKKPKATIYILHQDHKPWIDIPKIDVEKLQPAMDKCRLVKDGYEIARIRRANKISDCAHRAVLEKLSHLESENQIQGVFEGTCISMLAKKQAYAPIIGSGVNAGILHYTKNDESLKGRQLICLDAGGEYENYASDVTRTFPICGHWPSNEARYIYEIVRQMQEYCISMLQPGVKFIELHYASHRIAIRGLLKLGILHNGSVEEIFEAGTSKGFYPHGLGHHLGLDVHDVLSIPPLRYRETKVEDQCPVLDLKHALAPCRHDQPSLEEGMVVTVEPGIYFNRYELERAYLHSPAHSKYINADVLERYWAVGGVRIEDDLLITAHGYENLTTAPKGEEAMEIIRRGREGACI